MAWIRYVREDEMPDDLREIVRQYRFEPWESLDNILRIHSQDPPTLKYHYDYYVHLMKKPAPLTRVQREMIAVAVSAANHCHY